MMLLLGIAFMLLQGFFAGSETAYVVANPVRVAHLTRKTRNQEKALELLRNTELVLVLTLVGTNISVVLSGFFLTAYFIDVFGQVGTTVAIVIGTVGGLIFGEYLPKSFARHTAERVVTATAWFYSLGTAMFRPFRRIFKPPKPKRKGFERLAITRPDLLTALRLGEKIGSIEEKTSPRVANLFAAFDTPLADVMTPWDRIITITFGSSRNRIMETIGTEGFTRYPVIDPKSGCIKGILNAKDMLGARSRLRKPFFTQPGVRITDLLETMQAKHEHMAIVLDIDDRPIGIVTFEDLLEEFVGEIRSE